MQVKLDKVFAIDAPADDAWTFLQDIPAVAACLPGAEITDQVDDSHYQGTVKVKIGPASAHFKGDIEIRGLDRDQRELHLFGKGGDTKGTSSASMELTARIREAESGCELIGDAEVTVTGKLASLGGRMMTQVSDQILNQFGDNFARRVKTMEAGTAPAEPEPNQGLNALALLWSMLGSSLRRLFGRR